MGDFYFKYLGVPIAWFMFALSLAVCVYSIMSLTWAALLWAFNVVLWGYNLTTAYNVKALVEDEESKSSNFADSELGCGLPEWPGDDASRKRAASARNKSRD